MRLNKTDLIALGVIGLSTITSVGLTSALVDNDHHVVHVDVDVRYEDERHLEGDRDAWVERFDAEMDRADVREVEGDDARHSLHEDERHLEGDDARHAKREAEGATVIRIRGDASEIEGTPQILVRVTPSTSTACSPTSLARTPA